MTDEGKTGSLEQIVLFRPAQIRRRARVLLDRSRQCADLADHCVTEEGKQVLEGIATELRQEADQLEQALTVIRQLYAETFDNAAAARAEDEASGQTSSGVKSP